MDFVKFELPESTQDWLRSTEGLRALHGAWKDSIYLLPKQNEEFAARQSIYKNLKNSGTIIGFEIFQGRDLDEAAFKDGVVIVHDEQLRYKVYFSIHFSAQEDLNALTQAMKDDLAKIAVRRILKLSHFQENKELLDLRHEYWQPDTLEGLGDEVCYGFKWESVFEPGHDTCNEVVQVANELEIKRISGADDFRCLFKIIKSGGSAKNSEVSSNEWPDETGRFKGFSGASTIEVRLAKYLVSEGYVVVLEPDLVIPNPEIENYRSPDLLITDKGRTMLIEIDGDSHLTLNRWKRDRLLDRIMLCHGIPILRVYVAEADNNPEVVMTQVNEIFHALGGSRMIYS